MTVVAFSSAPALISSALRLLLDLAAHLRRLAQPRLARSPPAASSGPGMTFARSFVQNSSTSGRDLEVVADERRPFCTSRFCTSTVSDRALISRPRPRASTTSAKSVGRLLDEHLHARGREILALQLLGDLVELVERSSPPDRPAIARRRTSAHRLPHRRASCGPCRAAQMCGNVSASWRTARSHAGGVAAGDDERALLAERLLHQLDQPFARLQRRRAPTCCS